MIKWNYAIQQYQEQTDVKMRKLIIFGIVTILLVSTVYGEKHTWNITKDGCEFIREEQIVDNITSFISYDECYQAYLKNKVDKEYNKAKLEERMSNVSTELMSLFDGEGGQLKKEGGFPLILLFFLAAFIIYSVFKKKK